MAETIMYSIDPKTGSVVRHVLPWSSTNPIQTAQMKELHAKQLAKYIQRGYTFEPPKIAKPEPVAEPVVEVPQTEIKAQSRFICSVCGRECKSDFGLSVHMRTHKNG